MYWAPELIRGEEQTHKSDAWALGITVYQLITGELPFDTADEEAFRNDVLTGNFDRTRLAFSERLSIILENLLMVDVIDRWSMTELYNYI